MSESLLIIPLFILISIINNLSIKLQLSSGGKVLVYFFGIIGVPIHEFSHYLFCLIFKHRVDKVKLFAPDWKTGNLGYVSHSYNRRSIYQSFGQVFISLAPMIVGSLLIIFLIRVFGINSISLSGIFKSPLIVVKYITFIYIFMSISSYMICSIQDFKSCLRESICIFICIIICILIFPGVFSIIYYGLIEVLKLTVVNLGLSVLMWILLSRFNDSGR